MGRFLINLLLVATLFMLNNGIAVAQEVSSGKTEWDNGIMFFKSDDGQFKTRFDTRVYMNAALFNEGKSNFSDGTHLRKARFAMKTTLWGDWRAEYDIDVAEGSVEAKDMWLSYNGLDNAHIKIGHFKMPLGLNELMTSRSQTFVERAYASNAFEIDRRAGIEYSKWNTNWNFRGAVFGQPMDINKNKIADETGGGIAARFAFRPYVTDNSFLHTGIAADWENPNDSNGAVEFKSEAETKIGDEELLDTGNIFFTNNVTKIGFEGAYVYKNFSLQGEYIQANVNRHVVDGVVHPDAKFSGAYAFASWIITGETRPWDKTQGELGQVVPEDTKKGAWEVAARFSHLDLSDTDAGILGGMANNYTLGLNWYANPNVRFLFNYTWVRNSENATGATDGIGGDEFEVAHMLIMFYF